MRKLGWLFVGSFALLCLFGCPASEPVTVKQSETTPPSMGENPPPRPMAPKSQSGGVSDKELATFQSEYDKAKTAFEKDSKDTKKKATYVAATVKLGTGTMLASSLDSKVKYRGALRLYREALKYDATNEEALRNKKTIEDIYESLGRPIPE